MSSDNDGQRPNYCALSAIDRAEPRARAVLRTTREARPGAIRDAGAPRVQPQQGEANERQRARLWHPVTGLQGLGGQDAEGKAMPVLRRRHGPGKRGERADELDRAVAFGATQDIAGELRQTGVVATPITRALADYGERRVEVIVGMLVEPRLTIAMIGSLIAAPSVTL